MAPNIVVQDFSCAEANSKQVNFIGFSYFIFMVGEWDLQVKLIEMDQKVGFELIEGSFKQMFDQVDLIIVTNNKAKFKDYHLVNY